MGLTCTSLALALAMSLLPRAQSSIYTNGGACKVNLFDPLSAYLRQFSEAYRAYPCGDCDPKVNSDECQLGAEHSSPICSSNYAYSRSYLECYPSPSCPSNSLRISSDLRAVSLGSETWFTKYYGCRCVDGYYADPTATYCTIAPPGSYATPGGPNPYIYTGVYTCGVGTYSDTAGLTACKTCPAGKYADQNGLTACNVCPGGNRGAPYTCAPCDAGTYAAAGQSVCTACSAGKRSVSGQSACTACPAGKYETGVRLYCYYCGAGKYSSAGWNSCKSCTNPISANEYWSSYGTTSTNCPQKACTNALNNNFYTASGGTTANSCKLGACVNALPAQYYPGPGGAVARVTNTSCPVANCSNRPLVGNYLSGAGGTSSTSCPQAKCSNALPSQYYVGSGTASSLGSGTCPVANCSKQPLPYQYYSGPGGASAGTSNTSCPVAPCTNVPADFQYYSGHGGLNPEGCQVSTCSNPLETGQYYSGFGFTSTGCQVSNCANKPPLNTLYAPLAVNLNSSCAWGCVGGFYWDAAAGACAGCPKHTYAPFNTVQSCIRCEAGMNFPNSTLAYLLDTTNNAVCDWRCVSGYFKYNGTCVDPLEYKPPPTTTTTTSTAAPTTSAAAATGTTSVDAATGTTSAAAATGTTSVDAATGTTSAAAATGTTSAAAVTDTGTALANNATTSLATTEVKENFTHSFAIVADMFNSTAFKFRKVDLATKRSQTIFSMYGVNLINGHTIAPDGTHLIVSVVAERRLIKVLLSTPYTISTFFSWQSGFVDGNITSAQLGSPRFPTYSQNGSFLIVFDDGNYAVRKIDIITMQVTTLAGGGTGASSRDGVGLYAKFYIVCGMTMAPDDSFVLITECRSGSQRIRRLDLVGPPNVTTLAGGAVGGTLDNFGTSAKLATPGAMAISPDMSMVYFVDGGTSMLRTVDLATTYVQTLIPDTLLTLGSLYSIVFSPDGLTLFALSSSAMKIYALSIPSLTIVDSIGTGTAYDDSTADMPGSVQFKSPKVMAIWKCKTPAHFMRLTMSCMNEDPVVSVYSANTSTPPQPTTSTARPSTTPPPPPPPRYYVKFTLQTFALSVTPELLGAYASILAYLFSMDVTAIAMSTSTAPPPAVMRRRMRRRALLSYVPPPPDSTTSLLDAGSGGLTSVSTTPPPQVVEPDQMQDALIIYVTVSLQSQDQVAAITTLVNAAGFQDLLLAQCEAANLDAAYILDFSMEIVNLYPTSTASALPPVTTAVPVPAPAPAPAPSEIVPQPPFSASPHAARPCLPLVAALVFAVLQVFN